MRFLIASFSLLCLITYALAGTVDPPQRIKITKLDRTEFTGLVTSYADEGLEVMDLKKQASKIAWEELSPDAAINM